MSPKEATKGSRISDDAPFRRPRRLSKERREVGGRRREDNLPRADITKKVIAVIVFCVNLAFLVVDEAYTLCSRYVF